MDLSTGRRVVSGDSFSSKTFLISPEPPAPDRLKPTGSPPDVMVLPNRAIENEPRDRRRQDETQAEFLEPNPKQSSPTLLDLLLPKPSNENDELPVRGNNLSERIPSTRNESFSGRGDFSAEILRTKDAARKSRVSGNWSGAIFALAVIQAIWSDVRANRQARTVASDKLW
jgi:hypothetical protein